MGTLAVRRADVNTIRALLGMFYLDSAVVPSKPSKGSPYMVLVRYMRAMPLVLFVSMIIIGYFANDYALPRGWHHVPFWITAALALAWSVLVGHPKAVLVISSFLVVGMVMRAAEVFIYSNGTLGGRITATVLWSLLAVAYHGFAVINQSVVLFKKAQDRTWDDSTLTRTS